VCRTAGLPKEVLTATSLLEAVQMLSRECYTASIETILVVGGAAAFAEALDASSAVTCKTLHLTRVFKEFESDVFIPAVDDARYALADFKVGTTLLTTTCCVSGSYNISRFAATSNRK
jgi:dihydrofolate reductase